MWCRKIYVHGQSDTLIISESCNKYKIYLHVRTRTPYRNSTLPPAPVPILSSPELVGALRVHDAAVADRLAGGAPWPSEEGGSLLALIAPGGSLGGTAFGPARPAASTWNHRHERRLLERVTPDEHSQEPGE